MGMIIRLGFFLFTVWITISICARKGYPVWLGALLGVLLQPLGPVILLMLSLAAANADDGVMAVAVLLAPFVGTLLPIAVAISLPSSNSAETGGAVSGGAAPCPQCGRVNAITSRVCPSCETRLIDLEADQV